MGIEEFLLDQAEKKGIEKGIEKTTVSFVEKLLKIGMDAQTIAATFDLPLKNLLNNPIKICRY